MQCNVHAYLDATLVLHYHISPLLNLTGVRSGCRFIRDTKIAYNTGSTQIRLRVEKELYLNTWLSGPLSTRNKHNISITTPHPTSPFTTQNDQKHTLHLHHQNLPHTTPLPILSHSPPHPHNRRRFPRHLVRTRHHLLFQRHYRLHLRAQRT
jgi:hypothetical protein